jgi:trehalose synthase
MGRASVETTTLELIGVLPRTLRSYRGIVEDALVDGVELLQKELRGVRLLHLNSTAMGGGVAELLNSLVPLEQDCGLQVEWRVLRADEPFFAVTKGFHNALQGQTSQLDERGEQIYLHRTEQCAAMLAADNYDVVIVHDPQPAAIPHFALPGRTCWIWRCHIDSSEPDPRVWSFLRPYVECYHAAVFTMAEFVPPELHGPALSFIPPAIDPLSPKNRALPRYLCRDEVASLGIGLGRPLILQVSRFDPWKDPRGVIEAYRLVKQELPTVQLALVGSMASDDPEGWQIYNLISAEAELDPDIHVLTNLNGVGAHEVNAFQRVADVVIQKSIREGFGLVVSEAVWKETPVVGGNTGGIPLQIENGTGGFLVNSVAECADRALYLLTHPDEASAIAHRGHDRVRIRFLMPRLLRDELVLIRSLLHKDATTNVARIMNRPEPDP